MFQATLKESETTELKRSTSELKDAIIAMVAILNKHGKGELFFGVKNDGSVVGQDVTEKTLRDVSRSVSENIEPKVFPKIGNIFLAGKECIHVEFSGDDAPYFAFGRCYLRVGDEDRKVSVKELESMVLRKNKEILRWDAGICKGADSADISREKIEDFVKLAGLDYDSATLSKLNLLKGDCLTNAAVILFAEHPQHFFPNARLRCALFGTDDTSFIINMQDFEGDLFYLIERAEEYILGNINIGMRLEGFRRIDVPEIDKEAFREAVINAFCHRDYHKYDSVNIAVFRDRVEIRSPGLLYGGLTIEQIIAEKVSERRNELIADMFHKVHFVERWGKGISMILSKEPKTVFKQVGRQFIVVFKRKNVQDTKIREKTREKTREKILEIMTDNPHTTMHELAKITGLTEKGIEWNIKRLKEEKKLHRVGPDKGGHWEVIKSGRDDD